jgi:hypothetical protein
MDRRQEGRRVRGTAARIGLVLAVALAMGLSACGQAEDAARGAASDAASSAGDSIKRAATDEVVSRVCAATSGSGPLADVRLTSRERAAAGSLATAASAAGVAEKYVSPLRQVAASKDGQDVADAVQSLRAACADRTATPAS